MPGCFPSASSAGKSMAVLSSSLRGFSIFVEPSLTISSRHVSGVSRALTRSSPLSECGFGVARLTSRNASGLIRNGLGSEVAIGESPPLAAKTACQKPLKSITVP